MDTTSKQLIISMPQLENSDRNKSINPIAKEIEEILGQVNTNENTITIHKYNRIIEKTNDNNSTNKDLIEALYILDTLDIPENTRNQLKYMLHIKVEESIINRIENRIIQNKNASHFDEDLRKNITSICECARNINLLQDYILTIDRKEMSQEEVNTL